MSYMSGEYAEIIAFLSIDGMCSLSLLDAYYCIIFTVIIKKNTNNNLVHPEQQRRCEDGRLGVTRKLLIRGFMVGLEFVNYVKR